ncbi:MAG: hypothetical protein DMD80_29180 [Candidatus Rokuibacteriota bacterium]|nr:MAG: hypothetical protein DMD80_29180 [Candidatus Rokubacteria bacterium]
MRLGLYVKRLEVRQGRSGGARARRRRAARGSLRIALPPLELALRARYLAERRQDPAAAAVAAEELAAVERIRARLARQGWWN